MEWNSQTWVEIAGSGGSAIKDWAPVIAATITGFITLWTAWVISRITKRQADTASNKLALDLFEKRFAVWKALEKAYQDYDQEIVVRYMNGAKHPIGDDIIREWVEAEVDADWLFGPDVRDQIGKVGMRLAVLGDASFPEDSEAEIWEHQDRMRELVNKEVRPEFVRLRDLVRPYMMLDKIAVHRPAIAPPAKS